MKIKPRLDKVPGGLMLVPLFIGAVINTCYPGAGGYFGSFTNGILKGTIPILGVWFFCMGATIRLRASGAVLKKSGTLVVVKILTAWVVALIASRFLPLDGVQSGFFTGISTLVLATSMNMTNGGRYASLMQQYGSKEDFAAFVLMSIESGPLLTMIILGSAGVASFEPRLFLGAVLPFILGFILGNLDDDLREFFGRAMPTLIPFFAFSLGSAIDLPVIRDTGMLGILLGVGVIIATGIPLILADKFIVGGDGTAGIAASSSATPFLIAEMNPVFKSQVAAATALVATAVIVTSLLVPILTALWAKWPGGDKANRIRPPAPSTNVCGRGQ
ncbi:2-keto-3-deoxygluconate transporter [Acerihabitans arboris]|uniref:2-keto-3-deoxygluconate permease n=1 Tax=Acerihabitans arboris TaxID=2691583 RepID=A0A845SCP6_9GAMM|nr:2-keto-3-deoxygluconate transporter [Acerihabitans arboris]NDL62653.1 2-keto-3-deoxygluconate transporter [Acerihabitans arboris]